MLSEKKLFHFTLQNFTDEIAGYQPPRLNPLPCDRYVARSAFQKAIRRGEVALAHRALANLYQHDQRGVWRHAIVVAMEDCGAINIDLLTQIVAARLDRKWCDQMGGDWLVLAFLVERMATGPHCQAACDLLLRSLNDPSLGDVRAIALEDEAEILANRIPDDTLPLLHRGIAILALGGGLAEGQQHRRPACVFAILEAHGFPVEVITTCHAAWRASRNEMALLLPLVWQAWTAMLSVVSHQCYGSGGHLSHGRSRFPDSDRFPIQIALVSPFHPA